MNWAEIIAAAIGGGVVTSLINWLAGRGKARADTSKILAEAAETLIEPLSKRVTVLEAKITKLKWLLDRYAKRVIYLMNGIETLVKQIKANDEFPSWSPDEWSPDGDEEDS
jgi:hypothetical protein